MCPSGPDILFGIEFSYLQVIKKRLSLKYMGRSFSKGGHTQSQLGEGSRSRLKSKIGPVCSSVNWWRLINVPVHV